MTAAGSARVASASAHQARIISVRDANRRRADRRGRAPARRWRWSSSSWGRSCSGRGVAPGGAGGRAAFVVRRTASPPQRPAPRAPPGSLAGELHPRPGGRCSASAPGGPPAGQFGEYCPYIKAVEHLGDRWSLLIVHSLAHRGAQGFNALADGLPGISRSVLARRLRALEELGLLARAAPGGAPRRRRRAAPYRLAPAGEALVPTLRSLHLWAERWVPEDPDPGAARPRAARLVAGAARRRTAAPESQVRGARPGRRSRARSGSGSSWSARRPAVQLPRGPRAGPRAVRLRRGRRGGPVPDRAGLAGLGGRPRRRLGAPLRRAGARPGAAGLVPTHRPARPRRPGRRPAGQTAAPRRRVERRTSRNPSVYLAVPCPAAGTLSDAQVGIPLPVRAPADVRLGAPLGGS